MDNENNSFYDARAANAACQEHVCTDDCPRNSKGLCRTQIALWEAQHRAAMLWNQPEYERIREAAKSRTTRTEPDRGYL